MNSTIPDVAVPAAAPAAGTIRGFVHGFENGGSGAKVRLLPLPEGNRAFEMYTSPFDLGAEVAATRSGRDGYFEIVAPAFGIYLVEATAEGYLGSHRWVGAFAEHTTLELRLRLVAAREVSLTILTPEGRPASGVRLRRDVAGKNALHTWPFFVMAEEGNATLQVAADEDSRIFAWAEGAAPTVVDLPVGQARVTATLERGSPLAVEVLDVRGLPVADLALVDPDLSLTLGRTGGDGIAVVLLPEGQRRIGTNDAAGRDFLYDLPPAPPEGEHRMWIQLPDPAPITGQVLALPSREPLAGAWLHGWSRPPVFTRSDPAGRFELLRPVGRHNVVVVLADHEGYRGAYTELSFRSRSASFELALACRLEGRVLDAAGDPVFGARVESEMATESREAARESQSSTCTDPDGRFFIDDAPAGEKLELAASHQHLHSPRLRLEPLGSGAIARVELRLPASRRFVCRVADAAGQPIAAARVFFAPVGPHFLRIQPAEALQWEFLGHPWGETDALGRLETHFLSAGSYDLGVSAAGHATTVWRGVEVAASGPGEGIAEGITEGIDREIVLDAMMKAEGRVIDESGAGLAGVVLRFNLRNEDEDPAAPFLPEDHQDTVATTGERGDFSFAAVAAHQRFDLEATQKGYVAAWLKDVSLAELGPVPGRLPDLCLEPAARIAGKVVSRGRPGGLVDLEAEPIDAGGARDAYERFRDISNLAGEFEIEGIRPGRYRLTAHRRDVYAIWESGVLDLRAGEVEVVEVELERLR